MHIYMALGSYSDHTIDSADLAKNGPPKYFFTELECSQNTTDQNWHSRILTTQNDMPDIQFLKIEGIFCKDKKLPIKYENQSKLCYYELTQGKRYFLKLSLGNPKSTCTTINVSDSNNEIGIDTINPLQTSADFDNYEIPIMSKTSQVLRSSTFLKFDHVAGPLNLSEFTTTIEISLTRSRWSALLFGTLAGLALIAYAAKPDIAFQGEPLAMAEYIPFILWIISTAGLFYFFNKK